MSEPSDKTISDSLRTSVDQWLDYAQSDLEAASALLQQKGLFTNQICFLSQQAGEKSIKAALVFLQIDFPFIHNLDELKAFLPEGWECVEQTENLEVLSKWAVDSRYPQIRAKPSLGEAKEALKQAKEILESIQQDLKKKGY